ncbi:hypothetical protein [Solirubrum puertoriconensis]|uniref:STAS/SEC14 domain-containing protein n=1 Tax=Solirubrum puertoriconensis TaxID=1751427 RepID=A0A9X0L5D2_SOLP1|nr:hypothetical protein [Solirubrum puertoriconensis]KUG08568.1 hypothetical protein ASU33_10460 [Solirubrum puertoriconensis]
MQTVVLQNSFGKPFLTIQWDQVNNWVYSRWEGLLSKENVEKGGEQVLEAMQATGCRLLLNDNREVKGSWSQANDYIAQQWMPKAKALGLRRFAHILAPGLFAQQSVEEMLHRVDGRFEMRLFGSLGEATQWLKAAQPAPHPSPAPVQ